LFFVGLVNVRAVNSATDPMEEPAHPDIPMNFSNG
jgi:hypothetical protein